MSQSLTQCRCQLVGTRGVLVTTTYALQLADHVTGLHATHQDRNALQISMTTAIERHITQDALVINFHIDL